MAGIKIREIVKSGSFTEGLLNSYSQIFFSDNRLFALILILVTFLDPWAGLSGLFSVLVTLAASWWLGFDRIQISKGIAGFNSLLVGLGLGVYFSPGWLLLLILFIASLLTLFISVSLQGIIGKYALPYLSISFIFSFWIIVLATNEFTALGISERGVFNLNEMYILGGKNLLNIYEWWNSINMPPSLNIFFISLGAIFFQFNSFAGILIALGLLYYSRIAFSLSLLGFYSAYFFYILIGANISELSYSYIGFNFILTAIALGGFFIVPSKLSYLWTVILMPMVVVLVVGLNGLFLKLGLPIYSLPFNLVVLLFLYMLKFRVKFNNSLAEVVIQQNSPERNLYSFQNFISRFGYKPELSMQLPFFGEWIVSQGQEGEDTHKGLWIHAWDFMVAQKDDKTYRNQGDLAEDYFCYGMAILAPADGYIEELADDIPDNLIGEVDINNNWGNTIVIRHNENLYTKLSHLQPGSINVQRGDKVIAGQPLAKCGNSGRSPYPHLHFQVQSTPFIGSATIDYPLGHYLLNTEKGKELKSYSKPARNDKVSNIAISGILKNAFGLIPGKRFSWEVREGGDEAGKVNWEVRTNEFNQPYIECLNTGSRAFFEEDGALLFFTHFEGDRSSLLYYFYLAAYKVQIGYYQGLELKDCYPLNHVFRKKILFIQDFVAPFFRLLRAEYTIRYGEADNSLSPEKIELKSSSRRYIGNFMYREIGFSFVVNEAGIDSFYITEKDKETTARCAD